MPLPGTQNVSFFGPQALAAGMSPETAQQAQALLLQQRTAQGMIDEGSQPIDPLRQAGGWTVPISPLEGLAHAGKSIAGALMMKNATSKEADLVRKNQQDLVDVMTRGMNAATGRPATPSQDYTSELDRKSVV